MIIGLGNPILGDDSAGILAVRELKEKRKSSHEKVEIKEFYVGGIRLLEELMDYEKAVIVDAIIGDRPGNVRLIERGTLSSKGHGSTIHDVSISQALDLAEKSGLRLPELRIIGIEILPPTEFTENPSPEVEKGIKEAAKMVEKIMEGWN